MATTPVGVLGLKYPLSKELIEETSNKWQKRTKELMTKWPKEGTFDVSLCEEMETLIKNHKTKGLSAKRKKREIKREKEVLALFKKEGEDMLRNIKQARKMLKEADTETKKKEEMLGKIPPPPYRSTEGQFPMLKGTVEVIGETQMEGHVELEKEKETELDIRPKKLQGKKGKPVLPLDCYKQARTALEKIKTQYKGKSEWEEESFNQSWRREVQVQVELYCHSATCGDIQWNEMSCLTGPRCYINTDINTDIQQ